MNQAFNIRISDSLLGRTVGTFFRMARTCSDHKRYRGYRCRYKIADSFIFNGTDIIVFGDGEIVIGEKGYIGRNSMIVAHPETRFVLGRNCRISYDFYASTGNYDPEQHFTDKRPEIKKGDIIIGDGCLIGKNVFIREGVTIGDNCVVGAGSVVTHDLPGYSICAGSPCKVIKLKQK